MGNIVQSRAPATTSRPSAAGTATNRLSAQSVAGIYSKVKSFTLAPKNLCHNLYFNPSTSQVIGLTCLDDEDVMINCKEMLLRKGFINAPLSSGRNLFLRFNDNIRYHFVCDQPKGHAFEPTEEVILTFSDFDKRPYQLKHFALEPPVDQDVDVVVLRCFILTPGREREKHRILLEWKQKVPTPKETLATDPVLNVHVLQSARQFYELHVSSPFVYLMDPNRLKGKVLIINNEFIGQLSERTGSLVDVDNLVNLWSQLGFKVEIQRNLRGQDMHRSCLEFALNSVNINVLVLIIMSHGGNRGGEKMICGENNQMVSTEQIISYFTSKNAPHLKGIPKVFMFQACGAEDLDQKVEKLSLDADKGPDRYPERSDMLIVYPSQAGYALFRNRATGSWLMNAVTTVFMEDAKNNHVLDMLTKVNRAISLDSGGYMQMSILHAYLTKNLFLFPGCDGYDTAFAYDKNSSPKDYEAITGEQIRPSTFQFPSFTAEKPIGPEGGFIELLGCRLEFPPGAFRKVTIVKIILRSIYDDALEGYMVVSPEFECSLSEVSFEGLATITLPVHVLLETKDVTVVTKQDQNSDWEVMDVSATVDERRVTFKVPHFTIFKILSRFLSRQKTCISHNMYVKPSTSQLLAVTCIDDDAVKKRCRENLENAGFKASLPLPDLITLRHDDAMRYMYLCSNPEDCVIEPPTGKVNLTKSDFKNNTYITMGFTLEPQPSNGTRVVLQYSLWRPSKQKVVQRIGLDWKQPTTTSDTQAHLATNSDPALNEPNIATEQRDDNQSSAQDTLAPDSGNRPAAGTRRIEVSGAGVRDLYVLDGSIVDARQMPAESSTSGEKADNL